MRKYSWVAAITVFCALVAALPKVSEAKDDDMILRLTHRYEWNQEQDDTLYNMMVLSKIYPGNFLANAFLVSSYNAEGGNMKSNTLGFSAMKIWPKKADISIGYSYTYVFNTVAAVDADSSRMSFSGRLILWNGPAKQTISLVASYNTLTDFDQGQIWYAGLQSKIPLNKKWSVMGRARYAYSEDLDAQIFNEFMARATYTITKKSKISMEYKFYDMQSIGNVARDDNQTFAVGLNYSY